MWWGEDKPLSAAIPTMFADQQQFMTVCDNYDNCRLPEAADRSGAIQCRARHRRRAAPGARRRRRDRTFIHVGA